MGVNSETRLPRKLAQPRPHAWEPRVWHLGVCLIPVHSTLVHHIRSSGGSLWRVILKYRDSRGPEHYLMWRMVKKPGCLTRKREVLGQRENCSQIVEGFHVDIGEDIFFVALESKARPRNRNDRSTSWLNSRKDSPSRGTLHIRECHGGQLPGARIPVLGWTESSCPVRSLLSQQKPCL